MQCSKSLAWPTLSRPYLKVMLELGHTKEHAILSAMGLGRMALDQPGLRSVERVMLLEVVRSVTFAHVWGDALFRPHGGGLARQRASRPLGIRSSHVQGLAANNLHQMMWCPDALRACRDRYSELFLAFNNKLSNTDNIELGFSTLCTLNQGHKGDFHRVCSTSARADMMEALSNDPELAFQMVRRQRHAAKYDNPEFVRERDAMRFNDGSSSDPWSDGAMAYLSKIEKVALKAATAQDESVRSNFRGKGIGSGVLGA